MSSAMFAFSESLVASCYVSTNPACHAIAIGPLRIAYLDNPRQDTDFMNRCSSGISTFHVGNQISTVTVGSMLR
ncbi:hypothetical protein I7I50_03268 [Histoplasma capsulatum G186AR]|uniref:Uncharacterized protein n=1 Tax=Ajellomyces capsulatus TaxID=5037 RepID=A0A8H7Z1C1_AJECA|nr:hypothetical protein I7I52_00063 [Histoplasma capsulatum]QSS72176.1 hypothetical protein I7I50_03268 [Histoplasma capsulatum G186AR]